MRKWEPSWLEVTEKDVPLGRLQSPLRILHLSDFHHSPEVSIDQIETAIDHSLTLSADIAFLTGDFISRELKDASEYQRVLEKLSEQIPTFACIGNHDGGRWAASTHGYKDFSKVQSLLERSGIHFLFNQSETITVGQNTIEIVGLGDYWSKDLKPEGLLHSHRPHTHPIFVLSHNPDSKTELMPYDWDLMCCGHTHGGQLVIPFLGYRPFLPVRDKSFPEGLRNWGNQYVHITRGIGNLHGMRFNCRPEISILKVS